VFARVSPSDLTKRKSFDKGMNQLTAEGTVQLLWDEDNPQGSPMIAAVGQLQFEVLQYRLRDEYGVEAVISKLPFECSAWLEGDRESFSPPTTSIVAKDSRGRTVVLFQTQWDKKAAVRKHPSHQLLDYA
jgi:peptide chain release factor 3